MSSNGKIPETVNQIKIFSRDYPLLNKLIFFALFCHLVSFGSEYIGLVSYLDDLMINYFSERSGVIIAHGVSGSLAFLLELLYAVLIVFVVQCCIDPTYVNRSVIQKNLIEDWKTKFAAKKTTDGEELDPLELEQMLKSADPAKMARAIHVANWIKLSFAAILLIGFTHLSMKVSRTNVEFATLVDQGEAKQKDNTKIRLDKSEELQAIDQRYDQRIQDLQLSYQRDTAAIAVEYIGQIKKQQGKATEYSERGKRDGRNYGTAIARTNQQIGLILADQGPEIKKRSEQLSAQLLVINEQRDIEYDGVKERYDNKLSQIANENEQRRKIKAAQNVWMSSFLKKYAKYATIGQLIAWIWITLSRFTSGIEKPPRVKPEMISTTLLQDFWVLVTVGPSRLIQNLVRSQISKIRILRPLPFQGATYDIETLRELQEMQEKIEKTNSLEILAHEINNIKNRRDNEVSARRNRVVSTRRKGGVLSFLRPFYTLLVGVEDQSVEDVETKAVESVEKAPSTIKEALNSGVETKTVEKADSSVATPNYDEERGVETKDVESVEIPDVETKKAPDSTLERGVETKDVEGVEKPSVEKIPTKDVESVERRRRKPKAASRRKGVEKQTIEDFSKYEGLEDVVKVDEDQIPIRLIINGTEAFGIWYGSPRTESQIAKEKSNYQGFVNRGERLTLNTYERLEVAKGLLLLFTQHRQKMADKEILVSKK